MVEFASEGFRRRSGGGLLKLLKGRDLLPGRDRQQSEDRRFLSLRQALPEYLVEFRFGLGERRHRQVTGLGLQAIHHLSQTLAQTLRPDIGPVLFDVLQACRPVGLAIDH